MELGPELTEERKGGHVASSCLVRQSRNHTKTACVHCLNVSLPLLSRLRFGDCPVCLLLPHTMSWGGRRDPPSPGQAHLQHAGQTAFVEAAGNPCNGVRRRPTFNVPDPDLTRPEPTNTNSPGHCYCVADSYEAPVRLPFCPLPTQSHGQGDDRPLGHDMTVSEWCHCKRYLNPLNRQVPGVFWGKPGIKGRRSPPCPWGLRVAAGQTGVRVSNEHTLSLSRCAGRQGRHGEEGPNSIN